MHCCNYFPFIKRWGVRKCFFLGPDRPNLHSPPPPPRTENAAFHLPSQVGQFGYATPLLWGAEFIDAAISHH